MSTRLLHKEKHGNQRNSLDYLNNDLDYDLNYESIAAVHAMVRQMSSVNKMKHQTSLDQDNTNIGDSNNDMLDPAYHKSHSKRRKRTRIGVGDEPDIPNGVEKKYSFIDKEKMTVIKKRILFKSKVSPREQQENAGKLENMIDIVNDLDNREDNEPFDDDNEDSENVVLEVNPDERDMNEDQEEGYDDLNPNPVFKDGDFDSLPNNATKKPFHFEELSNEEHKNYANNLFYDMDYQERGERNHNPQEDLLLQDDMHINGRILHSSNLNGQHERKVDRDYLDRGISQMDKVVISPNDIKGVVAHADNNVSHNGSKRQQLPKISGVNQVHSNHNPNLKRSYRRIYNTSDIYVPTIGLNKKHHMENVIREASVHIENGLFIQEPPATQIQTPGLQSKHGSAILSRDGFPLVKGNIYWSKQAEDFVPKGKYDSIYNIWHQRLLSHLIQLPY